MHFQTVYYSRFWYSRFAKLSSADLTGNFLRADVERHVQSLRLLALFFEYIYIPRSHALTQVSPLQSEVAQAVFHTREVAFLRDIGVFRISTFPDLDPRADNERILKRAADTRDVTYAPLKFIAALPVTKSFIIDSARESLEDTQGFMDYARWLAVASPSLSRRLVGIVAQSEIPGVPFFHEHFLRSIRDQLNPVEFELVWRETNSVYLASGAPNQPGVVAYFDPTFESLSYRHRPLGIDRYLFNPASLLTFLSFLLTDHEIRLLRHTPIDRLFLRLEKAIDPPQVEDFRHAFCKMVAEISEYTDNSFGEGSVSQQGIAEWFRKMLDNELRRSRTPAEQLAHGIRAAGESSDAVGGLAGAIAKPVIHYASHAMLQFLRRRRHPAVFLFADRLRLALGKL